MTREQRDAALTGGVPVAQDHPLPAGVQKVRILVLDQKPSTVGAVTIPIKAN